MTTARVAEVAAQLWEAERTRQPIAPISDGGGTSLTPADAYAIQRFNVARRVDAGAVVRGRKVGLTSKAMQRLLGVFEPDFGSLLDDMFVEEGDPVSAGALIQPKAEAEIAFVMASDLEGPGATVATALQAVAGVVPAIEIIDSRIVEWKIQLVDTIADNASSARVVVGGRLTPIVGLDPRLIGAVVRKNGEIVETSAGAAALGNPVRCVAWLANKLAQFGERLRAGDVVLSGALHRAFDVGPGDAVTVELAECGSVTAYFGA